MSIIISKFLFASDLNFTGRPNLTSLTNWIHARANVCENQSNANMRFEKTTVKKNLSFPPLSNFYFEFVMIFLTYW